MEQRKSDRGSGRRDGDEGSAGTSAFGQRAGVRGEGPEEVACQHGSEDTVYRTGIALGERLLRKLQLEAAGQVPQREDLLL